MSSVLKISEKLRALRDAKGLTQKEVADRLGIAQQSYFNWEAGISTPKPNNLEKVAVILGTTPGYLMGWEEEEIDKVDLLIEGLVRKTEKSEICWSDPSDPNADAPTLELESCIKHSVSPEIFTYYKPEPGGIRYRYFRKKDKVFVVATDSLETVFLWGIYTEDEYQGAEFYVSGTAASCTDTKRDLSSLREVVFKSKEDYDAEILDDILSDLGLEWEE